MKMMMNEINTVLEVDQILDQIWVSLLNNLHSFLHIMQEGFDYDFNNFWLLRIEAITLVEWPPLSPNILIHISFFPINPSWSINWLVFLNSLICWSRRVWTWRTRTYVTSSLFIVTVSPSNSWVIFWFSLSYWMFRRENILINWI